MSCSENSEKSSEKVIGGWVDSEGYRGVRRYPVWYISGIGQAQKRGQDNGVVAIFGLGCVLNQVSSWGQMRFGLTGEWVKLGLVCVLVCQVRFGLCLSDRSG